jgi:hypothetical protein
VSYTYESDASVPITDFVFSGRPNVGKRTVSSRRESCYLILMPFFSEFFVALHKDQKLVHPKYSAHVLAALAVKADQNLTGQFINYSDDHMAPYQLSED